MIPDVKELNLRCPERRPIADRHINVIASKIHHIPGSTTCAMFQRRGVHRPCASDTDEVFKFQRGAVVQGHGFYCKPIPVVYVESAAVHGERAGRGPLKSVDLAHIRGDRDVVSKIRIVVYARLHISDPDRGIRPVAMRVC